MTTAAHSNLPAQSGGRRVWQIALLLALTGVAIYLWTATSRAERALRHASLAELQADAGSDPSNPRVFYYLGLRAGQAGRGDLAMDAFLHGAVLAPDDEALWLAWARTAAAFRGAPAAQHILDVFLKKHPESARAHLLSSQVLGQISDHRHAYREAKIAAALDPGSAIAWQLLGAEAMALGNYPTAEGAFRHASALAPEAWINRSGLGDALFSLGRYSEAAMVYREAMRLAPAIRVTHLALGRTLLHEATQPAEVEAARRELRQAVVPGAVLTPLAAYTLYVTLGQSYEQEGRWREALPWLIRAEPLLPEDPSVNPDVHYELARVYRELGDSAAAARQTRLHQARVAYGIQANTLVGRVMSVPGDVAARLALARLYAAHGYVQNAVALYRSVLALAPRQAEAQKELATLMRKPPASKSEH